MGEIQVKTQFRECVIEVKTVGSWIFGKRHSVTVTHIPTRMCATCCKYKTIERNKRECINAINSELEKIERRKRVCY